nr:MAG TPA: hypothetical protein [Caudoviricetes sp.]
MYPLRAVLVHDQYRGITIVSLIRFLTAYVWLMVYFIVYGLKIVSRLFYTIN